VSRRAATPGVAAPPAPAPPGPALRRPLYLAHRGASARAPENTLAAFEEAIRSGVDAIELDVRLSADGIPVILHDDRVDRTTDGRGSIGTMTLAAIKRLDAGSWFARRFRGEPVPSLQEALECVRGRCGLNIEIKAWISLGGWAIGRRYLTRAELTPVVEAVARAVRDCRFRDFLLVSSFSRPALAAARTAMPRAALGLILKRSVRGFRAIHARVGLHTVHPHLRLATPRRVRSAHALGVAVIPWPVKDAAEARRLLDLGADGLISPDPRVFHAPDRAGHAPVSR
jgi:glycerophosphoryl diester phosphodiesterase